MNYIRLTFICVICFLISVIWVNVFAQETITITTYYPSPYGVYKNLRIYPNDDFALGAACTNEGEMYYDASDHALYICSGNPLQWRTTSPSPACTFCLSCGGSWPSFQGRFSTDDDASKNVEVARGFGCAGALQQNAVVARPIELCCQ